MESEAFCFKIGDVLAQQAEFSTTKVRNEHNLSCQVPLAAATRQALVTPIGMFCGLLL